MTPNRAENVERVRVAVLRMLRLSAQCQALDFFLIEIVPSMLPVNKELEITCPPLCCVLAVQKTCVSSATPYTTKNRLNPEISSFDFKR